MILLSLSLCVCVHVQGEVLAKPKPAHSSRKEPKEEPAAVDEVVPPFDAGAAASWAESEEVDEVVPPFDAGTTTSLEENENVDELAQQFDDGTTTSLEENENARRPGYMGETGRVRARPQHGARRPGYAPPIGRMHVRPQQARTPRNLGMLPAAPGVHAPPRQTRGSVQKFFWNVVGARLEEPEFPWEDARNPPGTVQVFTTGLPEKYTTKEGIFPTQGGKIIFPPAAAADAPPAPNFPLLVDPTFDKGAVKVRIKSKSRFDEALERGTGSETDEAEYRKHVRAIYQKIKTVKELYETGPIAVMKTQVKADQKEGTETILLDDEFLGKLEKKAATMFAFATKPLNSIAAILEPDTLPAFYHELNVLRNDEVHSAMGKEIEEIEAKGKLDEKTKKKLESTKKLLENQFKEMEQRKQHAKYPYELSSIGKSEYAVPTAFSGDLKKKGPENGGDDTMALLRYTDKGYGAPSGHGKSSLYLLLVKQGTEDEYLFAMGEKRGQDKLGKLALPGGSPDFEPFSGGLIEHPEKTALREFFEEGFAAVLEVPFSEVEQGEFASLVSILTEGLGENVYNAWRHKLTEELTKEQIDNLTFEDAMLAALNYGASKIPSWNEYTAGGKAPEEVEGGQAKADVGNRWKMGRPFAWHTLPSGDKVPSSASKVVTLRLELQENEFTSLEKHINLDSAFKATEGKEKQFVVGDSHEAFLSWMFPVKKSKQFAARSEVVTAFRDTVQDQCSSEDCFQFMLKSQKFFMKFFKSMDFDEGSDENKEAEVLYRYPFGRDKDVMANGP